MISKPSQKVFEKIDCNQYSMLRVNHAPTIAETDRVPQAPSSGCRDATLAGFGRLLTMLGCAGDIDVDFETDPPKIPFLMLPPPTVFIPSFIN